MIISAESACTCSSKMPTTFIDNDGSSLSTKVHVICKDSRQRRPRAAIPSGNNNNNNNKNQKKNRPCHWRSNQKAATSRAAMPSPSMLFTFFFLLLAVASTASSSSSGFLTSSRLGNRIRVGRHPPKSSNWLLLKRSEPRQCSVAELKGSVVQQEAMEFLLMAGDSEDSFLPPLPVPVSESEVEQRAGFLDGGASGCSKQQQQEAENKNGQEAEAEIMPGMPPEQRALCPYMLVENVDDRRLPRKLTEVKCLCDRPSRSTAGAIRCEPLIMEVPVLRFDTQCRKFRRERERLSLGCVAVLASASQSQFQATIGQPVNARDISI